MKEDAIALAGSRSTTKKLSKEILNHPELIHFENAENACGECVHKTNDEQYLFTFLWTHCSFCPRLSISSDLTDIFNSQIQFFINRIEIHPFATNTSFSGVAQSDVASAGNVSCKHSLAIF